MGIFSFLKDLFKSKPESPKENTLEWYNTEEARKKFADVASEVIYCWQDMKAKKEEYLANKDLLDESDNHFEQEDFINKIFEDENESEDLVSYKFNQTTDFFEKFISVINPKFYNSELAAKYLAIRAVIAQDVDAKYPNYQLAPFISDEEPLVRFLKRIKTEIYDFDTAQHILSLCFSYKIDVDDDRVYDESLYSSSFSKVNIAKIDELVKKQKSKK